MLMPLREADLHVLHFPFSCRSTKSMNKHYESLESACVVSGMSCV